MILAGEIGVTGRKYYTDWLVENDWVLGSVTMIQKGETGILGEKKFTVCEVREWMCIRQCLKILGGENWSREWKILYSVGGR